MLSRQLAQDLHVGGEPGGRLLHRRESQLLEKDLLELLGAVDVETPAGQLVDLPGQPRQLFLPLPRERPEEIDVQPHSPQLHAQQNLREGDLHLAEQDFQIAGPQFRAKDLGEADVLVTLRNYYRKRQRPIVDAENRGMPIYVLRSNTVNQMQKFLSDLYNVTSENGEEQTVERALQETQGAINAVLNGERWIELPPAMSYVRRLQHEMARQANLTSHSYGKEPNRRVRIFRD